MTHTLTRASFVVASLYLQTEPSAQAMKSPPPVHDCPRHADTEDGGGGGGDGRVVFTPPRTPAPCVTGGGTVQHGQSARGGADCTVVIDGESLYSISRARRTVRAARRSLARAVELLSWEENTRRKARESGESAGRRAAAAAATTRVTTPVSAPRRRTANVSWKMGDDQEVVPVETRSTHPTTVISCL